jgi:nitroreductase
MDEPLTHPPGPGASGPERLRWYVSVARHAPSKHNAQPWRFAFVGERTAELYADATRALRASDPDDRELTIGCGAALKTYAIAVRGLGRLPVVDLLPEGPDGPLARITEGAHAVPTPDDVELLAAVPARHTNRGPLDGAAIGPYVAAHLQRAAEADGTLLQLVTAPDARDALALLVERTRRAAALDAAFADELRTWTKGGTARDGLPWKAGRQVAVPYGARFAHPAYRPVLERQPDDPLPAVLWTAGDTQLDWLRAGAALQAVLLRATVEGVAAAFLNAPLERPATRMAVSRDIGFAGFPQVVLRLGVGLEDQALPTPRRDVDELIG